MSNEQLNPIPLFDAIEHLNHSFDLQIHHLKSRLDVTHIKTDYKSACEFLYAYRGSAETYKSYRREIERLLQWSWFVCGKSLKDLRRADMELFLDFCQRPPKHWIG